MLGGVNIHCAEEKQMIFLTEIGRGALNTSMPLLNLMHYTLYFSHDMHMLTTYLLLFRLDTTVTFCILCWISIRIQDKTEYSLNLKLKIEENRTEAHLGPIKNEN